MKASDSKKRKLSEETSNANALSSSQPSKTTTLPETNKLPVGFYDDVVEDMSARGINIHQEIEKQRKVEQQQLEEFFSSVKEVVSA